MRNLYKISAIICIVFVLAVGVTGCVTSNPSQQSTPVTQATPVPTAVAAAPTTTPTAADTTSLTKLTPDQLATIDNSMVSQGYTVVKPLVFVETTGNGWYMYQATYTKDGLSYGANVIQTDSNAHAIAEMPHQTSLVEQMGFTGSIGSDGHWIGSDDNGSSAAIGVYGTNVIVMFAE
jgi:hypothetical protein